jgi:hypothetical protein
MPTTISILLDSKSKFTIIKQSLDLSEDDLLVNFRVKGSVFWIFIIQQNREYRDEIYIYMCYHLHH